MTTYTLTTASTIEESNAYLGVSQDLASNPTVKAFPGQRVFQNGSVKPDTDGVWTTTTDKFSSTVTRHGDNVASPTYLPPVLMYVPNDHSVKMPRLADSTASPPIASNTVMVTLSQSVLKRDALSFMRDVPNNIRSLVVGLPTPAVTDSTAAVAIDDMAVVMVEVLIAAEAGNTYISSGVATDAVLCGNTRNYVTNPTNATNNTIAILDKTQSELTDINYALSTNLLIIALGNFTFDQSKLPSSSSSVVVIMCAGILSIIGNGNSFPAPPPALPRVYVLSMAYSSMLTTSLGTNTPNHDGVVNFYDVTNGSPFTVPGYTGPSYQTIAASTAFFKSDDEVSLDNGVSWATVLTAWPVGTPATTWFDMLLFYGSSSLVDPTIAWDVILQVLKIQYRLWSVVYAPNSGNRLINVQLVQNGCISQTALVLQPSGSTNQPNWLVNTAPFVFERYLAKELYTGFGMVETYRVSEDPPIFALIRDQARSLCMGFSDPIAGSSQTALGIPFCVNLSSYEVLQTPGDLKIEPMPNMPAITIASAGDCLHSHEDDVLSYGPERAQYGADAPEKDPSPMHAVESEYRIIAPTLAVDDYTVMLRSPYITHLSYRPFGARPNLANFPPELLTADGRVLVRSWNPMKSNVVDIILPYKAMQTYCRPEANTAKHYDYVTDVPIVIFAAPNANGTDFDADIMINGVTSTISTIEVSSFSFGASKFCKLRTVTDINNVVSLELNETLQDGTPITLIWTLPTASIVIVDRAVRIQVSFGDMRGPQTEIPDLATDFPWINYYKHTGLDVQVHFPQFIDESIRDVDCTWRTPAELGALLSNGFAQPSPIGSSHRYKIVEHPVVVERLTITGVTKVKLETTNTCTDLLPGTIVTSQNPPYNLFTVDADGKVQNEAFPFAIGNHRFIVDACAPTLTATILVRGEQLTVGVTNYTPDQLNTLKEAGFIPVDSNTYRINKHIGRPVYGNGIVVEGVVYIDVDSAFTGPVNTGVTNALFTPVLGGANGPRVSGTPVPVGADGLLDSSNFPALLADVLYVLNPTVSIRVVPSSTPVDTTSFTAEQKDTLVHAGYLLNGNTATFVRYLPYPVYGKDIVVEGVYTIDNWKLG